MSSLFPCPQALSSATFSPPPLDGSLTIPEIYDYHSQNSTEHPLFVYDLDGIVQKITWGHVGQAIHRVVQTLNSVPTLRDAQDVPVVAILAVIDQLSYFTLTAGIMRAGYRAFPISPRNSERGVANLLQKMRVHHLLVSTDDATQRTVKAACNLLKDDEDPMEITLLSVPTFDFLFANQQAGFVPLPVTRRQGINDVALILHSSGSTSFPKPIPLTHRNLIQWGMQPYFGGVDLCGRILSNHSLPFFHAMGVLSLAWATLTGVTLSNFAPKDPPIVVTPDRLFESAVACRSNFIFCVPTFLEEWSQSQEKLAELQRFEAIMFGGAPIQKVVGDMLTGLGIRLYPFYGATELGGTSRFLPNALPAEGWEYFKISSHAEPLFLEQDAEEKVYRLLFRATSSHNPAVNNAIHEGVNVYDTNDLVIRHPTNPMLLKIYGRADDQIMHSTGEKTNPVPMETVINRHPMIQSSVMFGRGRFQAGVLIEPKPEHAFDPADRAKLAAFRLAVWPSIEAANNFGPSHSRIFKEIILVAHPSKPFQYTPKGTPRRQVITNEYEKEIEEGYMDLENTVPIELNASGTFSKSYVSQVVEHVMGRGLRNGDDFFLCGCDSLRAAWIRNNLVNILRSIGVDTQTVPTNFVYLYPTIDRLFEYLSSVADGCDVDPTQETIRRMNDLVEKYSRNFAQRRPVAGKVATKENILLTGSTGGLGSYLLETLVLDNAIAKIYCLNRKARTGSLQRQVAAFKNRGIDTALLDSDKLVFLEGETDLPFLGLSVEQYEDLRDNITSVLHVAWRVDFNVSISSMEPLIAGTRALVDLCLCSSQQDPPCLIFASSIGVVRNWKNGFAPEEALPDATVAVGSGYPESKWVAEQILHRATQQTGVKTTIVRIGQLSGGKNGYWSPSEWVPSVIRTAPTLKCLPDAPGRISWISAHLAAEAFAKMRSGSSPCLHLVHPHPTTWTQLFVLISKALDVPLVPYAEWLSALERLSQTSDKVPSSSLQLLDFYQSASRSVVRDEDEAFGFPRLSTSRAEIVVPSLLGLAQLGVEDASSWLSYWDSVGALTMKG